MEYKVGDRVYLLMMLGTKREPDIQRGKITEIYNESEYSILLDELGNGLYEKNYRVREDELSNYFHIALLELIEKYKSKLIFAEEPELHKMYIKYIKDLRKRLPSHIK